jgi:hypothetical protein
MADTPEGYRVVPDSEDLDDLVAKDDDKEIKKDAPLVKAAIEYYRKKKVCKVFIAKDRWPGKKKAGNKKKDKNADLIIVCESDRCKNFVVIIECKGGKNGVDKAVKQLEDTSKAANQTDPKLIPDKIKAAQLKNCFHSILLVTKDFDDKERRKLHNPGNETPLGDQKKFPELYEKENGDIKGPDGKPLPSP